MIYVICGLIGAGKTTYAYQQAHDNDIVTDIDVDGTSKDEQLERTMNSYQNGLNVYHVTCYPTDDEQSAFGWADVEYIWINTSPEQAKINIISRGRSRDVKNLKDTLRKNSRLLSRYAYSKLDFKIVDVFDTTEQW